MWAKVPTNKAVGGLFPNDSDGNAWGDPKLGFAGAWRRLGYKLVDPGRFPDMNDNFSNYIGTFKKDGVEIVTGVVIPPDIRHLPSPQANQQGYEAGWSRSARRCCSRS